jgi:hypothetical protein
VEKLQFSKQAAAVSNGNIFEASAEHYDQRERAVGKAQVRKKAVGRSVQREWSYAAKILMER